MPPKGEPLTEKEVAVLAKWIDEGLPWEAGFTFKPATYVAPLKPRQVDAAGREAGPRASHRPHPRRLLRREQGRAARSRSTTRRSPAASTST